ncbi:hypothetical protein [Dysgonomonas reticulitermitis]
MTITQNYKKRWFLPLIFLAILYACTSEQDYQADTDKPVEPLTVATAQSLYEQYVGKASKLKSSSEGLSPELIPDWSEGQLFSDSNWYVVESPLETSKDLRIRFMTPEVKEYSDANNIRPQQILRQIIMRNKQTGLDYAFMMVVMPDLDYMLRKGNDLDENLYLTREPDLSGLVMFYTTDGEFVNGWVYENGRITGGIGGSGKQLKAFGTICYNYDFYGVSQVTGDEHYIGSVTYCKDRFFNLDELCNCFSGGGGGIDFTIPPITGGGGGNSSPAAPGVADDKKPEERTDCSGSATTNATNAQNAMKVPDVLVNLNFLREYAKGKENEWSMLIDSYYGSYTASALKELGVSSGKLNPNANTVYDVHTHSDDKREGYFVLTGPSIGDVYGMFDTSSDLPNFKGTIVIAYDGSEYLLAVNDRSKLQQFWGNTAGNYANRDLFKSGNGTFFENGDMNFEFEKIIKAIEGQKYSFGDAYDYALSYLLDKHNTGLKVSKKEKGESSFKEMKTNTDSSNNYKPTICP